MILPPFITYMSRFEFRLPFNSQTPCTNTVARSLLLVFIVCLSVSPLLIIYLAPLESTPELLSLNLSDVAGTDGITSDSLYSLSSISVIPACRAASNAELELLVTPLAALVPVET